MSDKAPRFLSVDEFLAWQAEQAVRYEFVDGRPMAMTGAKLRHDRVTMNAVRTIGTQLDANGSPCEVFSADIAIRTGPQRLRRPDASVLCPPFDEDSGVTDRPRLVLEVLSESTEKIDRIVKTQEYQALDSLDYILIVEPTSIEVGFWYRDATRAWRSTIVRDREATLDLPALGLILKVATLYRGAPLAPRAGGPRLVWDNEPDDAG